jgi:hypothetical protein
MPVTITTALNPGGGHMPNAWVKVALVGIIAILGLWVVNRRTPAGPPPSVVAPPPAVTASPWLNTTWLKESGRGVIRFRPGGSDFSADGVSVARVRPSFRGEAATFQARVGTLLYEMSLRRDGDTAQLVGVRVPDPPGPIVIAPGGISEPRRVAAGDLVPEAFGTYRRVYP